MVYWFESVLLYITSCLVHSYGVDPSKYSKDLNKARQDNLGPRLDHLFILNFHRQLTVAWGVKRGMLCKGPVFDLSAGYAV